MAAFGQFQLPTEAINFSLLLSRILHNSTFSKLSNVDIGISIHTDLERPSRKVSVVGGYFYACPISATYFPT